MTVKPNPLGDNPTDSTHAMLKLSWGPVIVGGQTVDFIEVCIDLHETLRFNDGPLLVT